VIRPARPGDVPAIHRLVRELAGYERSLDQVDGTEDDLRRSLFTEQPAVFALVAEHEGAMAGFALWFLNYSTWTGRHGIYLEDLSVTPQQRRHGHGRALLAELARICVERGYGRFEWSVLDWNEPAIGFYRALGAVAMDEWTVHRLTGPALAARAALAAPAGRGPGQRPATAPPS
jgi:ribosomal protein S18 acetylase RimI-like enzyme